VYFFLQAPPTRPQAEVILDEVDQMVEAESLGYDSVWLTEHHYADYGLSSAPSVLLTALASRTQRIRLGIAVYVMPFHHPLRLAEETATIDILSHGRLTVGLGRGNRPLEYFGHGVLREHSRTRMEEGVDILLQAWTRETVNYAGLHWNIKDIPVYPKPLTRPHPPIAVAVTSPESIDWAARKGFAMLSSGLSNPLAANLATRQAYVEGLERHGHSPETIDALLRRWVVTKHVYVAPTDAEAAAEAYEPERWYRDSYVRSIRADGIEGLHESVYRESARAVERMSKFDYEALLRDSLLVGSPETVIRKLGEMERAGVGEVACWMNFGGVPPERVRRSMRLFADEVMPVFRRQPRAEEQPEMTTSSSRG
jgi:alkanesulfonate monooxygenase SsuD/methylene tetrahydromethanopterin reductase-like flavin-dependent oxidoreductase (luciferase family)